MPKFFLERKELLIDVGILVCLVVFILSFFDPALLLLKSTINGGDTGSHYPNAVYLKDVLLPHGKIMGWMQGNYAGFPLFYHYFPFPFLLASGLGHIVPLEISFKLVTILGTLLLPVAIYFAFRSLRYGFPLPVFAAIFSLAFLFHEGNSMWGGNIPSTLAGEFCYSLGFALVFLLFGTLYRGVKEQRFMLLNATLIFLIGFSHAYTLIFSLMIGSYFLLGDFRRNGRYIFGTYALGALFLAFWILPLVGNIPYTTSLAFRWTIKSLREVFPAVLIPFMAIGVLAFIGDHSDDRSRYALYLILACLFSYLIGPYIGVLDIRMIPFFQFLMVAFGVTIFSGTIQKVRASFLLPPIFLVIVGLWVSMNTSYVRQWIQWNYSGYETKRTWAVFSGINTFLRQSGDQARVEWEHAPADEALGSIRSSETLPFFAGRQTLEGIHMLGSISAPFVFYVESETSPQACNPIPDYFYSTLDLRAGIEHFKLFNVSQFVVSSPSLKEAIKTCPEFRAEKAVGDYHIYRLTTNSGRFVEPLANEPILFPCRDWRDPSYQWFARKGMQDVCLVFKKDVDDEDRRHFGQIMSDLNEVDRRPYLSKEITVHSVVRDEAIEIETSEIGHPLLVKVSYHPNWRVMGADRVYLASPSFMLIFPAAHRIRLTFEPGLLNRFGAALTLLGILLAAASPFWFRWIRGRGEYKESLLPLIVVSTAVAVALVFLFMGSPSPDRLMALAHRALDAGQYALSQRLYRQVSDSAKRSSGRRNEAAFNYATTFIRQKDFARGAEEMRRFIAEYPNSFWTPQAYFDLAHCERNLGNLQESRNLYRLIRRDFPTTTWAKYSEERERRMSDK
jgi:hypothetical protein